MIRKIILLLTITLSLFLISGCEKKQEIKIEDTNKTTQNEIEIKEDAPDPELIEKGVVTGGAALYQKEMQKACNMSGYSLARKMSKEEWKEIAENGKFALTIKKFCPDIEFQNNWTPDIYEYLQKNALSKS